MSDYTPSWAGSPEVKDETPAEDRFGDGVDYHAPDSGDDTRLTDYSAGRGVEEDGEDGEAPERIPVENANDDPSNHGDPRHPSAAVLSNGEYYEELGNFHAHRCGGGYTIVDQYDDLPAGIEEGDTPMLCVTGIREGDTDSELVTVSSIRLTNDGRFEITYTYDGELGALDRWLDEGCLLCQEGEE